MNVILRPVFNRPEMMRLSFEYEIAAREHFMLPGEFITVFIIEHGSPQKTLDLVEAYPFENRHIIRNQKLGLSINILEGMKEVFTTADDYIIHLEDDVLLHKTYFQYMNVLFNMDIGKFSVLSPFNQDDGGNINEVYKGHHYAALAPLITKKFFMDYIIHCINPSYYKNFDTRANFVASLDKNFVKDERYKYKTTAHNEQAGLINRLVDIAMIQDDMHVMMPRVNRQQHIGYFGKNRPGGTIPGNSFDERLINLREIIKDANMMYKLSKTPQYNDYAVFSPKLEEWDGTLYVK